ncbi:hypothetical protein E0L36_16285 [Streptomyces sp. AJS327]|uniref:hypothetical protein n=1 Tax=Streptomyces sp. AJS327 TaxID=2545265 RepID=UPI0015DDE1D9|nr:hypothetical protein [Streptomyces sp. AJS327]MBA0052413.1 hypothetical protein [Streptomyces sp. AJS327]
MERGATERLADTDGTRGTWYTRNAKRTRGEPKPGNGRVCSYVRGKPGPNVKVLGKACFKPYGDQFWIKDLRADGLHLEMRAMYGGNPQTIFNCKNYHGKAGGWTVCTFANQMREKRGINFALLAYQGNSMKFKGGTAPAKS